MAAARRIVADEGLEALTFAALERRLAFTRGVITHHFRDKEEIVHAVLVSAVEEIDDLATTRVRAAESPEDKIREVVRSMVAGFLDRIEAGRVLLSFWGRLGADARAAEVNAALYRRYRREGAVVVADGVAAGAFRPVDPDAFGALLVALVIGIVTQAYFDPAAIDVEEVLAAACDALLASLRNTP